MQEEDHVPPRPPTLPSRHGRCRSAARTAVLVAGLALSYAVGAAPVAAAVPDRLTTGESLRLGGTGTSALHSASAQHKLSYADSGDGVRLVQEFGIFGVTPVLSIGGPVSDGAELVVQGDGNVVLHDGDRTPLWSTRTSTSDPTALVLQDDGNLVLYNTATRAVLWFSGHAPFYVSAAPGVGSTQLIPGHYLVSADRRFRLILQNDGNLVQYGPGGALWSTGTAGAGAATFVAQADGNLVVYSGGRPVWQSGTGIEVEPDDPIGFTLVLQDDANLVLYVDAPDETFPIWSSTAGVLF